MAITQTAGGGFTVTGPADTNTYRQIAIKVALKGYLKHGLLMNRARTPSTMVAAIAHDTGKTYPRGRKGQEQALADITAILEAKKGGAQ